MASATGSLRASTARCAVTAGACLRLGTAGRAAWPLVSCSGGLALAPPVVRGALAGVPSPCLAAWVPPVACLGLLGALRGPAEAAASALCGCAPVASPRVPGFGVVLTGLFALVRSPALAVAAFVGALGRGAAVPVALVARVGCAAILGVSLPRRLPASVPPRAAAFPRLAVPLPDMVRLVVRGFSASPGLFAMGLPPSGRDLVGHAGADA